MFDLLGTPDPDDDRAVLAPDALEREEDAQVEAASTALADPAAAGTALLDEMTRVAEESRALPDARVQWVVEWVRANLIDEGN